MRDKLLAKKEKLRDLISYHEEEAALASLKMELVDELINELDEEEKELITDPILETPNNLY